MQSVSYRDGNPLVEFTIGAQERYLLGSTLRLNGVISIFNSSDNTIAAGKNQSQGGLPIFSHSIRTYVLYVRTYCTDSVTEDRQAFAPG